MIVEIATLQVIPEKENDFEQDFKRASRYIAAVDGYIAHRLLKCVEEHNKYVLYVEWQSIDAHEVGFRLAAGYQEWKKLLHHYYDPFPVVQHYTTSFSQTGTTT